MDIDIPFGYFRNEIYRNFIQRKKPIEELFAPNIRGKEFQKEVEQKTYTTEQLNQALELENTNTMSDEDKIGLITLKYEKDIQKKTDDLIALYKDQSEKELDVIRFENTDL